MRVCQFRHDGKWTFIAAATHRRRVRKTYISILQTRSSLSNHPSQRALPDPELALHEVDGCPQWLMLLQSGSSNAGSLPYSSFAFIVIFAFSTFETGHPFSAASAYF
jgi:hypothetical protein